MFFILESTKVLASHKYLRKELVLGILVRDELLT